MGCPSKDDDIWVSSYVHRLNENPSDGDIP